MSLLGLIAVVGGATGWLRLADDGSTPANAAVPAHQATASATPPPAVLFPLQRPAG